MTYENHKLSFLGVSGVYLLQNKLDSSRIYIGSSIDLSRRIFEYFLLSSGLRNPTSTSEVEISQTKPLAYLLFSVGKKLGTLKFYNIGINNTSIVAGCGAVCYYKIKSQYQ